MWVVKANEANANQSSWSISFYNNYLRRSDPMVQTASNLISLLQFYVAMGNNSIVSPCLRPKGCMQDWTASGTTSQCEKSKTVCDYKCDSYHFGYGMKVACDASSGTWSLGTPIEYFQYFPQQACNFHHFFFTRYKANNHEFLQLKKSQKYDFHFWNHTGTEKRKLTKHEDFHF